jgi:rod shape-determining protein MreB
MDIGIDLGTTSIIANDSGRNVIINEPALVAVDLRTDKILEIGAAVYKMVGRTPDYIEIKRPLKDGVISDYKMTEILIRHLLQQICKNQLVKPRVIICVPSEITAVESQAVVDSAVSAGARNVYLIEESVAAAIGAGIDLTKPSGNLIVDIGGGTTDVAVLSLNGIVAKTSIRVAGHRFDDALVRYVRNKYNLLVGEKVAETVKIEIGSVDPLAENKVADVKGRDLITGLPRRQPIERAELYPIFREVAEDIVAAVQSVLERTPPELVGDIFSSGIIMTGGGALIHGLAGMVAEGSKAPTRIADHALECVAMGTAKSFAYIGKLYDGLVRSPTHRH